MRHIQYLLTLIIALLLSQPVFANAGVIKIQSIDGLALVDDGNGYTSARAGMEIAPGQQIFVLEQASVSLGNGECSVQLGENTLFLLKSAKLCANGVARLEKMGTQVALALGDFDEEEVAVQPVIPERKPTAEELLAEEKRVDDKINQEVAELEVAVEEPSLIASIGSTLAIPAAVAGAVVFSVIAGGGGEEGGSDQDPNPNNSGLSPQ